MSMTDGEQTTSGWRGLLKAIATKLTWHWVFDSIMKESAPGRGRPLHFGWLTPALCLIGEVGCKIFHLGIGVRATPVNSNTSSKETL